MALPGQRHRNNSPAPSTPRRPPN